MKCLRNKEGFIEWLESVTPQGAYSRSNVQENLITAVFVSLQVVRLVL
jgi:hypothetical protein